MKINAGEIRVGMLLEYKNDLWQVLKTQHVKPGKGGAFAQVEMKSINKNTKLNERFRSSETVEKASLEETKYNYLYEDEKNYFFIEPKSFEQIEIKKDIVGEKGKLLIENLINVITFITLSPELVEKNDPPNITSKRKTKKRFLGISVKEIPIFETLLQIETRIFKKLLSQLKNINDNIITMTR